MRMSRDRVAVAVRHVERRDPVMRCVIRRVGPFTLRPTRDRFGLLVRSIISQQISTSAARAIRGRLQARMDGGRITAASLAALSLQELRSVGLSLQKAGYLHDLAARERDGGLNLRQIGRLEDEAVIEQLVQVRGVGRWTAQMFLIFGLGRLDVFPHDDLGVRAALKRLYGLDRLPDSRTAQGLAEPWRPYATVGTWYCWRSAELERAEPIDGNGYPV